MRGVRWRALSPWAHNAGTADKTQGLPGRMFGVNTSCRAAIPGGCEWHGQALQDGTHPDLGNNASEIEAYPRFQRDCYRLVDLTM
jgi:hypothetical protein